MYYINIVIHYNERYILIIILIIYNITKTENLYPLKHSLGTALSPSLSSVYSYFTYMIWLTKLSHVAPKMQHVTFCGSIVRFDWCRTKRIDSVCGVTWIPLCARNGSVIAWGKGEGETLSIHVVSTQCASGLRHQIHQSSQWFGLVGPASKTEKEVRLQANRKTLTLLSEEACSLARII